MREFGACPLPRLLCLAGATATGKSALAQYLAERHGAAILSADAMLVYRGMDIGTAKPTADERARVPYYGLDCVTPADPFSVAQWLERARAVPTDRPIIAVGGTGLYFSARLRGLDETAPADPARRAELAALPLPELQARLAPHRDRLPPGDWANPRRLVRALEILESGRSLPDRWIAAPKPPLLALTWPRPLLHERIVRRVQAMYRDGLLDETEALLRRHPVWSPTARGAIGYAEAADCLAGRCTREEAMERTIIRTRQLARRQETYLRHQFDVTWLPAVPGDTPETLAPRLLDALTHKASPANKG